MRATSTNSYGTGIGSLDLRRSSRPIFRTWGNKMTDYLPPSPAVQMMQLINGYQVSQALHVAATLGIADLLRKGPRSSDALADIVEADRDALYRLLRALAAVGVFHEDADRIFSLTELGVCLRSDAP